MSGATTKAAAPPQRVRPVVILGEDDEELRKLLGRKLRRLGCEVIEARNGIHLAELVFELAVEPLPDDTEPASLVITDHRMPGRTGLEVLALLRTVNWDTPVIFITGFGDAVTHAEAHRLGASAVLDKPCDLDALAKVACGLIGLGPAPTAA